MAEPVISKTSSILSVRQGSKFNFQAYASNTPVLWRASTLPPGLTISSSTGRVSGIPTEPGTYIFSLQADNDGLEHSAWTQFELSIRALNGYLSNTVAQFAISLPSGAVRALYPAVYPKADDVQEKPDEGASKPEAVIFAANGDKRLFEFLFERDGDPSVELAPPVSHMRVTGKAEDTGALLFDSGTSSIWTVSAVGDSTRFRVWVPFTKTLLAGALAQNAGAIYERILAMMQVEWRETNNLEPVIGDADQTISSQPCGILLQLQQAK